MGNSPLPHAVLVAAHHQSNASLSDVKKWCREQHGPERADSFKTSMFPRSSSGTWIMSVDVNAPGRPASVYFEDADAAVEFKMVWG